MSLFWFLTLSGHAFFALKAWTIFRAIAGRITASPTHGHDGKDHACNHHKHGDDKKYVGTKDVQGSSCSTNICLKISERLRHQIFYKHTKYSRRVRRWCECQSFIAKRSNVGTGEVEGIDANEELFISRRCMATPSSSA